MKLVRPKTRRQTSEFMVEGTKYVAQWKNNFLVEAFLLRKSTVKHLKPQTFHGPRKTREVMRGGMALIQQISRWAGNHAFLGLVPGHIAVLNHMHDLTRSRVSPFWPCFNIFNINIDWHPWNPTIHSKMQWVLVDFHPTLHIDCLMRKTHPSHGLCNVLALLTSIHWAVLTSFWTKIPSFDASLYHVISHGLCSVPSHGKAPVASWCTRRAARNKPTKHDLKAVWQLESQTSRVVGCSLGVRWRDRTSLYLLNIWLFTKENPRLCGNMDPK